MFLADNETAIAAGDTPSGPPAAAHDLHEATLGNGLRVVYESMPWLPSLSAALVMPFGSATDPEGAEGATNVLHEWMQRGAGDLDSRALSDAMEDLGMRRGGGAGRESSSLSASFLIAELEAAMPLFASVAKAPRFDDAEFESARELALQELESLEDAPNQKLMTELLARYLESPQRRSAYGSAAGLASLTPDLVREEAARCVGPEGAVLALAGGGDWTAVKAVVERAFADWTGSSLPTPPVVVAAPQKDHVDAVSAQVQIGLAFTGPEPGTEEAYIYAVGLGVLSGSSGARLFTEVREKRGLVYSVSAFNRNLKGYAYTVGYAGTTPDRAEETLEVFMAELKRLDKGVSAEEIARAKSGLLSSLVMQGESSSGTAGRLAADLFNLGRARTLDEIRAKVEAVTLEQLNDYLASHPVPDPTIVTLGPSIPLRAATPSAAADQSEATAAGGTA
ncbi:MAG TPA: pitrilysin family protein [Trueperaceae bacterium]|nr:pitrilysin family protein [Trueperaceae bacterium]